VKKLASALIVSLALAGCQREVQSPSSAQPLVANAEVRPAIAPNQPPHGRDTTVRALPPLAVRWQEVSRDDHHATIRAVIERRLGIDMPFAVSVVLPPNVKLAQGRTAFTLSPNPEADVVNEDFVLSFEQTPATDALLQVDGDTGVFGFHSKIAYRFGRPEPELVAPQATGPHVILGGRDFGPSIILK